MRKMFLGLAALCVLVAGCGDGPKKKLLGFWKMDSNFTEMPTFIEFTEKQMIPNGQTDQALDIVIEEKDGRAVVRRAGTDDTVMVVAFAEDKSASMESPMGGGRQKLLPSSREEMQDTLFPSPDKLVGFWARTVGSGDEAYHDVIEIGKGFVRADGAEDKTDITSNMGYYHFPGTSLLPDRGRLNDKDTLAFGNMLTGTLTLKRVDKETADAYAAEKQDLLGLVLGVWLSDARKGPLDLPEYLEISPDAVVRNRNGEAERLEGRLVLAGGVYAIVSPEGRELIRLERTGPDSLALARNSFSFGSEPSFTRSSAEAIAVISGMATDMYGSAFGIWKKTSGRDSVGMHPFLEVTAEYVRLHNKDEAVTNISGSGSTVNVKTLPDRQAYRFSFPRENILRLDSPDYQESGEYQRSSAEERDAFLGDRAALPDRVAGYWRSVQGDDKTGNFYPLAVTREAMVWGGSSRPASIVAKNDRTFELVSPQSGERYATLTLQGDGTVQFDPAGSSAGRGRYERSDEAEYGAIVSGRAPLPAAFQGYWLCSTQEGVAMRHDALLLRDGETVRNGYAEPSRLEARGNQVRLFRSDLPNYEIARVHFDANKREELRLNFFAGDLRYRKVSREEYEAALAECRLDIDGLFTDFVSERIERKSVPQAAIQFVKGQPGQWPVVLNSMGLTVKNDEAQQGVLPGIFDISAKRTVVLRGGDALKTRLAEITILDADTISMREFKFLNRELKFRKRSALGR